MSKKSGLVGGFVASNASDGKIEDCYCVTSFDGKNYVSGGFAGESKGNISTSYCQSVAKGLDGGFVGNKTVIKDDCYFVCDKESKKNDRLWDKTRALLSSDVKNQDDEKLSSYDTENVWKYEGEMPFLKFIDMKWFKDKIFKKEEVSSIPKIKTAKELLLFAEMVNRGDKKFTGARVILENDIDLGGKTWTPIGEKRQNAFTGVFDGNGHTIKNFVIQGNEISHKGFFGYLKGEVYNLSLDCQIKGDGCIGGIAASNEGTIDCCSATIECQAKGEDVQVGGLVGINHGHISRSYVAGKIKFFVFPLIPLILVLASASVALAAGAFIPQVLSDHTFNEITGDPNQVRLDDEYDVNADKDTVDSDLTTVSFTFYQEIDVNLSEGTCLFDFMNPSSADSKLVIQLEMDEETAKQAYGGANWDPKYYDAATGRVILGTSGAVNPGYILSYLKLNSSAQENLNKSDYDGFVVIKAYNVETNELESVQTELPVSLVIY